MSATYSREEREEFLTAYRAALLWTATSDGDDPEPLDSLGFEVGDFSPEALAAMDADCDDFLASHADDIRGANYGDRGAQWSNFALAGHDFLLTRQGHGAGFWDRGLGELGEALTAASKVYGDTYVWVNGETLEVE